MYEIYHNDHITNFSNNGKQKSLISWALLIDVSHLYA